ncbi:hypothetical protein E2562_029966 [Oryza meyeriana var. granulata]|uniref:Uncharacterized protein n=1 Tax=Oryza meyeriana var. granulata TaxID=110450 RepID=A0A6G1CUW8_9ORYZ|nr:hypothetical protein E2562_029966 [Oryza meyeriana var. granulata]
MPSRMMLAFAQEASDFDRQIGCMAGMFQIFDRRRLLTACQCGGHGAQGMPCAAAQRRRPTARCAPPALPRPAALCRLAVRCRRSLVLPSLTCLRAAVWIGLGIMGFRVA